MLNSETADIETSTDEYAARFAGSVGEWLLAVQERIIKKMLARYSIKSVLDIGGGHGQLTSPLTRDGYSVTVLGSAPECAHRLQTLLIENKVSFIVGNVMATTLSPKSFDSVVSIRLIPHCSKWEELIAEMCRLSRGPVIVDYPPLRSFNILYSFLFALKRRAEGNTRPFSIFTDQQIIRAFRAHGFVLASRQPQFFLPMVIHRVIKKPFISSILEGFFRLTGLTYIFGSPTIVCFIPK